ncbi:MAG: tetratricopeptide repeat protein [Gemmatimonadota bacterium]
MTYSTTEVAELLGISPARVRRLARSAELNPGRDSGDRYEFAFRDLVLLRTAVALEETGITPHRLLRAIRALGAQLPEGRPLTAVRITSEADELVVVDGSLAWNVETGQTWLQLQEAESEPIAAIARRRPRANVANRKLTPNEWCELGCMLQEESPVQAEEAFRNALSGDPLLADAAVNLGFLLHERQELVAAEEYYRVALEGNTGHAMAAYNLGVVLEDLGTPDEALAKYSQAIESDPLLADAYYNLARLCEERGDRAAALRHLRSYSDLVRIG